MAGDIRLDIEQVPLDSVAAAWQRQAEGARGEARLVP
jgi:hypothetical protein